MVACTDQVSAELEGELVILSIRNGEYYGLNPVGTRIWALIQEPTSLATVRDQLLRDFPDVDETTCTADVLALITELAEANLVDTVPPASA